MFRSPKNRLLLQSSCSRGLCFLTRFRPISTEASSDPIPPHNPFNQHHLPEQETPIPKLGEDGGAVRMKPSGRKSERDGYEDEQARVLRAAISHVPSLGWSESAMISGARDVDVSPSIVGSFPRREAALVESSCSRGLCFLTRFRPISTEASSDPIPPHNPFNQHHLPEQETPIPKLGEDGGAVRMKPSGRKSERDGYEDEQARVLRAAISHVPSLGWSESAMISGARDVDVSPSIVGSFPRREAALVESSCSRGLCFLTRFRPISTEASSDPIPPHNPFNQHHLPEQETPIPKLGEDGGAVRMKPSGRKSERDGYEDEQARVLRAAISHVPSLGWSESAMISGARDVDVSPSIVGSFPRREAALVEDILPKTLGPTRRELVPRPFGPGRGANVLAQRKRELFGTEAWFGRERFRAVRAWRSRPTVSLSTIRRERFRLLWARSSLGRDHFG
ncbi:hypothetical protein KSP40_PGU021009 [Platanthera guangdongensis]|uniref:Ubiquinone biosynthesis protein n=1 Tax=Platanthera guangdongensis TaxID=2320717 RepID=A0ABR2MYS8_9ASPA